jgi:hypothetical protein
MKKFIAPIAALSILASPLPVGATTDIESNIRNIVYIECGNWENDEFIPVVSGSGVAIGESHVITNAHVVADEDGYYYEDCIGGISTSSYVEPEFSFWLEPVVGRYDDYFDYAIMAVENDDGSPHELDSYVEFANSDAMVLNESIYVLGYPSTGGATITASIGSISGFTGTNWFKSDVDIDQGNSGGGAFDTLGNFFAIPTAAVTGEINSISYLQSINAILEDAFGADIAVRDYDTLYSTENTFCFDGNCYNFASDEAAREDVFGSSDEVEQTESESDEDDEDHNREEVLETDDGGESIGAEPEAGKYVPEKHDAAMVARLKGRILLQVEEHGEAWYINPNNSLRYYMANGDIAYEMMRSFSLGITNADLAKIPSVASSAEMLTSTSICSSNALANRLKGYILLQVEEHGEAWYIHPDTCRRIYMKDGDEAYDIMRFLSLGIANADLEKLPSGTMSY